MPPVPEDRNDNFTMHRIVFFDFETTGKDPYRHQIRQVGLVAYSYPGFVELEALELNVAIDPTRVDPELPEQYRVNTTEWNSRPDILPEEAAISRTADFLGRHAVEPRVSNAGNIYWVTPIGGHNISAFDMAHLYSWNRLQNLHIDAWPSAVVVDTINLTSLITRLHPGYRGGRPPSLKLGEVSAWLGLPEFKEHDALDDARASALVAQALMRLLMTECTTAKGEPEPGACNINTCRTQRWDDGGRLFEPITTLDGDALSQTGWYVMADCVSAIIWRGRRLDVPSGCQFVRILWDGVVFAKDGLTPLVDENRIEVGPELQARAGQPKL